MKILGATVLMLFWWASGAEAACTGSGQTWTCSAGTTVAQVNSALTSAADGATITFATGSYSWASEITLSNSKGVSLICASEGNCSVSVGGTFLYMDTLSGNNTKVYRLSGFKFQNAPSCLCIWLFGNGTLNNLRIDHNTFQNFHPDSIAIFLGETSSRNAFYGVIDNNKFIGTNNFMTLKLIGHGDTNNWGPSPKGTANNLFFEDNTITYSTNVNLGAGCVDVWNSGAIVWRHNTTQNCLVTAHGVTHGGVINFELYENRFIRTANSGGWEDGTRLFHHQGSGEMTLFNNVFSAASGKGGALALTHYRSASPSTAGYDSSLGQCNGSSSRDGNRAPTGTYFGYPCWRQPGRDGSQNLQPIYAWGNRWSDNGEKIPLEIENPWGGSNPSVTDHIKPNRDYYDAVSASAQSSSTAPFNGSTGMGFGTLARRPTTCTTNALEPGGGVGYFATDQGSQGTLYRCSATNTWSVQYRPFAYPHPLRAGDTSGGGPQPPSAPNAPTNLRISSGL